MAPRSTLTHHIGQIRAGTEYTGRNEKIESKAKATQSTRSPRIMMYFRIISFTVVLQFSDRLLELVYPCPRNFEKDQNWRRPGESKTLSFF